MTEDDHNTSKVPVTAHDTEETETAGKKARQASWYCKWRVWDRIVKVGAAVGTVGALIAVVCQVSQTGEQIDAMWYSMRPILRVHSITKDDVAKKVQSSLAYPTSYQNALHLVWHTLENTSPTPARIDSFVVETVYDGRSVQFVESGGREVIEAEAQIIRQLALPLDTAMKTSFKVSYAYRIEGRAGQEYTCMKGYSARWVDGGWSFWRISPDDFAEALQDIPDSLRVVLRNE